MIAGRIDLPAIILRGGPNPPPLKLPFPPGVGWRDFVFVLMRI
ncbi:hypothetical protein JOH51_007558 [Rhizobium leguminosarum]|nr:hypothetical protein [Rhizobium leguminosarum]